MDAGNTKIQKRQNKDMISTLPEEILVHILSFFPTKEAIKTSILSKRWPYLWVSDRNFSFYDVSRSWLKNKTPDQALDIMASFLDSIERALLHRNAQCLGSVCISLNMHVSASRLSSWLSAAVEHKVRNLDLYLPKQREFVWPDSLFTSMSLSNFYLQLHSTLKLPSFICFSSLKRLQLVDVLFHDDQSTQSLFSGCPVLEDLTLRDCHWDNLREITIGIPSLRSFTFYESRLLQDHFLDCKIIVTAKNLESLDVSCYLTIELVPSNLPCLDSASIDIRASNGGLELVLRMLQLLSGLRKVKSLILSRETLEPLRYAENLLVLLPTFYNLTSLGGLYKHPVDNDYASAALVYILEKSPNLETLHLPRGFKPGEEHMMLERVPACFLSSLKCFLIADFDGDAGDVSLLEHVYKNAPFLKRLAMSCLPTLTEDSQKQEEIHQQLRQLRDGSVSCSIEFMPYDDPKKW